MPNLDIGDTAMKSQAGDPNFVTIHLVGKGSLELLQLLESNSIPYKKKNPIEGVIHASGSEIVIAGALITAAGHVIAAWINASKARNLITHSDVPPKTTNTPTPEDCIAAMQRSGTIYITDTDNKSDKSGKPDPK